MSYSKTTWQTGDTVTAELLNHMEDGISSADAKELPAVSGSDNGKVLTVSSGAWSAQTPASGELPNYGNGDSFKVLTVNAYGNGLQWSKQTVRNTSSEVCPHTYAFFPYGSLTEDHTSVPDGSLFDHKNTQEFDWQANEGSVSPVALGNGSYEYTFTFTEGVTWYNNPNSQDIIFADVHVYIVDEDWENYYYNNAAYVPYNTTVEGAEGWNMTITYSNNDWVLKIVTDSNYGKLYCSGFFGYVSSLSPLALMLFDRFTNVGT